ncbi:MAG: HAMP domain-containing sensor histidine kinase [Acidimicrobiia bacterium]
MQTATNTRQSRFLGYAAFGSWLSALTGGLVLFGGWGLGIRWLLRPFPVGDTMQPTTALCFVLTGFSVLLLMTSGSRLRRLVGGSLAALAGAASFAALYGYLSTRNDLRLEHLLSSGVGVNPGQMAPNTALAFFMLAIGLLLIDSDRRWAHILATTISLLLGFVAASGYALGVEGLYGVGEFSGMAVHSSVLLVILSLSILAARPTLDPMVRLTWSDSGGTMARALVPLAAVLFAVISGIIGWLTNRRGGVIPSEIVLLENILGTLSLLALIWYLAGALHRGDQERRAVSEQAMHDKDKFMASVGHELRTPVAAVVGFAELLSDMGAGLPEEERHDILEMMARQGSDLVALLEDLLVAARTDTGSLSVARVRVNLRAQVAQAVEGLLGPREDITVDEGGQVFVEGDPLRVRQILRNLLTNAQRYGGETVGVEIRSSGTMGVVRVRDNGPGMAAEDQIKVFEPYVTLHGEAGRPGSVGLGLPVARGLAIRMGGDLHYFRDGGWSVFELALPLFVEPAVDETLEVREPLPVEL